MPTFVVKLRPSDLPLDQRPAGRRPARRRSSTSPAADINATIDGNPGSTFDLVRIASDVDENDRPADLGGRRATCRASRSSSRPGAQYADGPLLSQILGYTGPVSGEQLTTLKASGYLPDDLIGKAGIEAVYETAAARHVRQRERRARRRPVAGPRSSRRSPRPSPGDSLNLTIDTKEQQNAQKALHWAMKEVGIKRGVVIVMNPQTGEVLALVSLPTYDNNQFARGISNADYAKLLNNPDKPLLNHAIQAHYPPGSTYKLVAGHRRAGRQEDHRRRPRSRRRGYLTLGSTQFYDWNHRGFGPCDIYCGFGHSSDTFFFQMAGKLGIDRLGYWAKQYGFGAPTGIDLPGEVSGIVPTNEWKQDVLGAQIFPGETYQAGIGQGYDVVTPIQLINAYAALANGGTLYQPQIVHDIVGPDGTVVRPFKKKVLHKMKVPASVAQGHAQRRAEHGHRCATPTTWSTCRSRSPASPARPSSGRATARAGCRSTRGSSGSSRRIPRRARSTTPTRSSSSSPSPTTRGPRATSRPRS